MDYILLMLKISSLKTILSCLQYQMVSFLTDSCLYFLFDVQKIFQFLIVVPEREKYFPPLDIWVFKMSDFTIQNFHIKVGLWPID